MDVRSGKKGVNAGVGSAFQGAPGALDVAGATTRQGCDDGTANLPGQHAHRLKIAFRCDGKPRLEDVDTQSVQLVRHADFLGDIHAATRRLLPVAQGGIEYCDVLCLSQICLPGPPRGRADFS